MAIYKGQTKVANLYKGDTKIEKVYKGTTLLYSSSRLPSAYQEVEYLESSGTQYIDSGVAPNQDTKVQVRMQKSSTQGSYPKLFGSEIAYLDKSLKVDIRPVYEIAYGTFASSTGISCLENTIYDITFEHNLFTSNNESFSFSTTANVDSGYNIYIFACNRSGNPLEYSRVKLFNFQIYDNNVLVRNFVPCYRKADNVAGLYDMINDVFYTNAGTGTFVVGGNV